METLSDFGAVEERFRVVRRDGIEGAEERSAGMPRSVLRRGMSCSRPLSLLTDLDLLRGISASVTLRLDSDPLLLPFRLRLPELPAPAAPFAHGSSKL